MSNAIDPGKVYLEDHLKSWGEKVSTKKHWDSYWKWPLIVDFPINSMVDLSIAM